MIPYRTVEARVMDPGAGKANPPKPSEIADEGFGGFRGVWPIFGARSDDTAAVLDWERRALAWADRNAADTREFEEHAKFLENLDDGRADPRSWRELPEELADGPGLFDLELGVAGLVMALANAGFFPAASCRSHFQRSWSDSPVVLLACDRARVTKLRGLVLHHGAGLQPSDRREDGLFQVYAPSVTTLTALAADLFATRKEYRKLPKTERRQGRLAAPRRAAPEQPQLF